MVREKNIDVCKKEPGVTRDIGIGRLQIKQEEDQKRIDKLVEKRSTGNERNLQWT